MKSNQDKIPKFKTPELLKQAFVHRSYLNEQKNTKHSNERMEYLGDAVLELITSEYLYLSYPDLPEGKLTSLRAQVVQTQTLAWAADKLNLGRHLQMSKGETMALGHKNPSILADTFEALTGAIYLDSGYQPTRQFILKNLLEPFFANQDDISPKDHKSTLQETVQAHKLPSPEYKLIEEKGPDHNKTFNVAVIISGKTIAYGQGKSKQRAEQDAAKRALEKKFNLV